MLKYLLIHLKGSFMLGVVLFGSSDCIREYRWIANTDLKSFWFQSYSTSLNRSINYSTCMMLILENSESMINVKSESNRYYYTINEECSKSNFQMSVFDNRSLEIFLQCIIKFDGSKSWIGFIWINSNKYNCI